MTDAREIFVGARFAKDKKMFVHDEIKAITARRARPTRGVCGVMLRFDDFFLQRKANFQAAVENEMRKWNVMLSFACVANQNRALAIRFENAIQFTNAYFEFV